MALLPPTYLDSIVAIGVETEPNKLKWITRDFWSDGQLKKRVPLGNIFS